jgi:RHS repeat-associated protein
MTAKKGLNTISSFTYTLGPNGNRTNVAELSGRNAGYTYDDLSRLTGETITSPIGTDPTGVVTYSYDNVGNRQTRNSTLAGVTTQTFTGQYDTNDRLTASGYVYDDNGSTLNDPNGTYVYDALGRMTSATVGGVTTTYVYDGDGNKVSQTVNGVTTNYLIDSNNLTGYAQVLDEIQGGSVNRTYTYGTSRISQDLNLGPGTWNLSFFGYDGQGSVRYLTDSTGTITDTYDYDAFGTQIHSTGTTANVYHFDGEQQDANTGFYNLRARWMNPGIGRFTTADDFEGSTYDPPSLHKYLYGIIRLTV